MLADHRCAGNLLRGENKGRWSHLPPTSKAPLVWCKARKKTIGAAAGKQSRCI